MGVYRCHDCDLLLEDDTVVMHVVDNETVCVDCMVEYEEEGIKMKSKWKIRQHNLKLAEIFWIYVDT